MSRALLDLQIWSGTKTVAVR
ncbi:hypothetical protein SPHINGOR109_50179 [Sphingorhabdus sp. 109]|nr:hypothetical protein SPHINGOR109_50179 [Sphingorhabdus sp. 109]